MSGVIHPGDAPRDHPERSEVEVWNALRACLPDGWIVWHSLRIRDDDRIVYEADFVVASPEFGMLVLEVKGGRMEIRDGFWFRDGQRLEKCPLWQARNAAHCIDRKLGRLGVPAPPFGAAVLLPGVEFSDGPSSGDLAGAVIGRQELPFLDEALRAAAARVVPKRPVPALGLWTKALHRLWGESWVPTLSTRDAARFAERRILQLDAEQLRLLDLAEETPRALVTGAAGTGKTLVARELCRRRARRGQRTLYLCFTRALGAALRRDFPESPQEGPPPHAATVRQLAVELLGRAGRTFDLQREGAWDEVSLEGAAAAETLGLEPYDLVVVDEAFDLAESDWMLVEVLSRGRDLWAFSDPRQHFWQDRNPPSRLFEGAARLNLPRQHRNPPPIEAFAARYAGETPPDAGSVRVVEADPAGFLEAVAGEVARWRKEGAQPSDIAIVTLAGQTRSRIVGRSDLLGEPLAAAESEHAATRVVADTFLRFKGFERPFVVVTELGGEEERREYDTRMYVALTRATADLSIVCTQAERRHDPRLAGRA